MRCDECAIGEVADGTCGHCGWTALPFAYGPRYLGRMDTVKLVWLLGSCRTEHGPARAHAIADAINAEIARRTAAAKGAR